MLYEDILRGFAKAAMPLVDWERRECMAPDCGCRQYECATVQP